MTSTTTLDTNLLHCLATGASLTACLHFCNQTPTDWYSKNQSTAETATYGSEFVAAKTATEQIMDLTYTLKYLGVPINSTSYIFGDNRSVVTNATLPHSTLSKRHNILAFHMDTIYMLGETARTIVPRFVGSNFTLGARV